jgi:hypothetical protein
MKTNKQEYLITISHKWLKDYTKSSEIKTAIEEYFNRYFLAKGCLKVKVEALTEVLK